MLLSQSLWAGIAAAQANAAFSAHAMSLAPRGLRTTSCFQSFHAGLTAGARMRCLSKATPEVRASQQHERLCWQIPHSTSAELAAKPETLASQRRPWQLAPDLLACTQSLVCCPHACMTPHIQLQPSMLTTCPGGHLLYLNTHCCNHFEWSLTRHSWT